MAEHAWVLEHVASYLADGLDAAERADFETHTSGCPSCARAVEEARGVEQKLCTLFADVRPRAGLEDRMIQHLRTRPATVRLPRFGWMALSAAAVVMVGLLGAGMVFVMEAAEGRLGVRTYRESQLNTLAGRAEELPQTADDLARQARDRTLALLTSGKEYTTYDNSGSMEKTAPRIPPPTQKKSDSGKGIDISAGKRAMSVPISADRAVGSFVVPGSHVDVVHTVGGVSSVLLENTQVLSMDLNTARPEDKVGLQGGIAMLQLDNTDQALKLAAAKDRGSISLVMRPPGDDWADNGRGPRTKLNLEMTKQGKSGVPVPPPPPTEETFSYLKSPVIGDGGLPSPTAQVSRTSQYKAYNPSPTAVGGDGLRIRYTNATDTATTLNFFGLSVKTPEKADPKEMAKEDPGKTAPASTPVAQAGKDNGEAKAKPAAKPEDGRKVIQTGELDFEIDSFEATVERITRIVKEENGYRATVNSDRLPNGKVKGTVVVRVPPERLETLILKLRALGDLKSQRIGSADVTKHYTDMESRLKAARAMEQRLLDIIKTGKGEIKDLLLAEKELGNWRTKIEEFEGELRYLNNQVAMSTLTVSLVEREIRAASGITETAQIDLGIEVEDVDKAQQQAQAAIAEAKGRILKSELKQNGPGQYQAIIQFLVTPDAVGPLRDRLRQLGEVTRQDVNRLQRTEGGNERLPDTKVKREDVRVDLSLFNLANFVPREQVHLDLATADAEAAFRAALDRARKASARIVSQHLDRQRNDQTRGTMAFEVKTAEADAILADLKAQGEVMRLQVVEAADNSKATRAKRGFVVQVWSLGTVEARETAVIQIASKDVPASYRALQEAVARAKGRVRNASLNEQDRQNVTGQLDFEVPRADEPAVNSALPGIGDLISRNIERSPDRENVVDTKVLWKVTLLNQVNLKPRETITLGIEVPDVDRVAAEFIEAAAKSRGKIIDTDVQHLRTGEVTARIVFDVPLDQAAGLAQTFRAAGAVRMQQVVQNPQVPEGELAIARLNVTLSNAMPIVAGDQGLGISFRKSLGYSVTVLSWILTFIVVGLTAVVPLAIVGYAIYGIVRRIRGRGTAPAVP